MSRNSVIEKLEELPPEARKKAGEFVEFLYTQYVKHADRKQVSDKPISESPFVGMWKNRNDMANSTEWVKKRREKEWNKRKIDNG